MTTRQEWTEKASIVYQTVTGLIIFGCGCLFMYALRNASFSWNSNEGAAFILGTLLTTIGAVSFFTIAWHSTTVCNLTRRIIIRKRVLIRNKTEELVIPFSEIESMHVGGLGSYTSLMRRFHVELWLKDGRKVPLWFGYYPDVFERAKVVQKMERLKHMVFQR